NANIVNPPAATLAVPDGQAENPRPTPVQRAPAAWVCWRSGRAFAAAGAVRKGGGWEVPSKRRGREELVLGVSPFLASVGIFAAFLLPVSLAADAGGAAGTEDTGATGATSTVVGIGALASARGHEKLSARPAGALRASPRLRTRVAIESVLAGAGPLWAPKSSPLS